MTETYHLGIDVGTSRVAAATARLTQDGSVLATQVALGRRSDHIPAVVFVTAEGELLFGNTAERRGLTEPERLLREFRRSVGDEVPMLVAGNRLTAESLFARTVAAVVDTVTEREGAVPARVVVTHPASWGPHRKGLIRAALADLGLQHIDLLTEPEAAARNFEATRPLDLGDTLVVYDLGGGTFEATVLRRVEGGAFTVQGQARLDDLGGTDFDDAVLRHVLTATGLAGASLDVREARIALTQLRRECIDAKESLSFDSDVAVPVLVPPCNTTVRLTRSEFEGMIEQALDRTLDALDDALERAGIGVEQVVAFLLVGGSSRIPRVAQRLSELFDRPLAIDPDPKSSIALGAARAALVQQGGVLPAGTLALRDEAPSAGGLEPIDGAPRRDLLLAGPSASPSASTTKWYAGLSLGALTVAAALWFGGSAVGGLPGIVNEAQPARMVASPTDDSPAGTQPEEPAATAAAPNPDQDEPAEPAEPDEPALEVVEASSTTASATSSRRPSAYLGVPASVLSPTPVPKPTPSPTPTPTPRPTTSQLAPIPDADPSPTPSASSPTTPPATPSDPTFAPTTPPVTDPPLTPATTPSDPEPTTPAPTTPAPTTPAPTTPAPTTPPAPEPTTPAPEPTTPAAEPEPTQPPPDPTPEPTSV